MQFISGTDSVPFVEWHLFYSELSLIIDSALVLQDFN